MKPDDYYPIGGYAPGVYMCSCCHCGDQFTGDKRAVHCEPCATRGEIVALRQRVAELEREARAEWEWGVAEWEWGVRAEGDE